MIRKRKDSAPYWGLDFDNFLIHGRILLDRAIRLARPLFGRSDAPSLYSFRKHRDFFLKPENIPYPVHEEYAKYVREQTGWFPRLKLARDKYIVHRPSPFYKFFGWDHVPAREMCLVVLQSGDPKDPASLRNVQFSHTSPVDLIGGILGYLDFLDACLRERRRENGA